MHSLTKTHCERHALASECCSRPSPLTVSETPSECATGSPFHSLPQRSAGEELGDEVDVVVLGLAQEAYILMMLRWFS